MWSSRKNGHGLEVGRGNALKMNGNLFACLGGHLGRQELAATVSAVFFFCSHRPSMHIQKQQFLDSFQWSFVQEQV